MILKLYVTLSNGFSWLTTESGGGSCEPQRTFGSLEPEKSSQRDKILFFIQKSSIKLINFGLSVMKIHAISLGVSDRLTVNTRKGSIL